MWLLILPGPRVFGMVEVTGRAPLFSPWGDQSASCEVTAPSQRSPPPLPPPFLPRLRNKREEEKIRESQMIMTSLGGDGAKDFLLSVGGGRDSVGTALWQQEVEEPGKEGERWQREGVREPLEASRKRQEGPRPLAAVSRRVAEAPFHTFSFCCLSSMAGLRFWALSVCLGLDLYA